jgi:hypothetical protein
MTVIGHIGPSTNFPKADRRANGIAARSGDARFPDPRGRLLRFRLVGPSGESRDVSPRQRLFLGVLAQACFRRQGGAEQSQRGYMCCSAQRPMDNEEHYRNYALRSP